MQRVCVLAVRRVPCAVRVRACARVRVPYVRAVRGYALGAMESAYVESLNTESVDTRQRYAGVPKYIPGTAGRYAMDWYLATQRELGDKGLALLEMELLVADDRTAADADWQRDVASPLVASAQERRELVTQRLRAYGLTARTTALLADLVGDGEVHRLPQIAVDFAEIMRAHRREVEVVLTTGRVTAERLALLQRSVVNDFLKPDDQPIFTHSVDPAIHEGYRVAVNQKNYDRTWDAAMDATASHLERQVRDARDELALARPRVFTRPLSAALDELSKDKEVSGLISSELRAAVQRMDAQRDRRAE